MQVLETQPPADVWTTLPGAQFADAHSVMVRGQLAARLAAQRMFGRSPGWVAALLKMRDSIVSPFGVKTTRQMRSIHAIGIFPVICDQPERIILGLDDRHLDFRVIVDVVPMGADTRVTATTVVRTHNRLGRVYLAAFMPFHRLMVGRAQG